MKKFLLFFALVIFTALIVGLGLVLKRFPVLAAAMALGPLVITLAGAALALLFPLFYGCTLLGRLRAGREFMSMLGIILLCVALPARSQSIQDSKFKIQDSETPAASVLNAAPIIIASRKPSWTERRAFKFAAVGALHAAGLFDAYSSNTLIDGLPPAINGYQGFWAVEHNPLLKPFAGHWTMYPAIQLGDGVLSTWLLRARGSRNRKIAFAVVTAQIGMHIAFGIENLREHDAQWQLYHADLAARWRRH
jgi:hypothetical protein